MWWWMRWLTSEEKKTKFLVIDEVGQVGLVQSVTFVRISTQMNIRIYLYQKIHTNEYPNIFILKIV